jgi:phosphopantothenoylcysteine synthetase/decarboxylase
VEPAQKKKAVTPTTVAAPALAPVVAPVVESLSKRSKDSGIVVVAGCAHVVSVAPSVDTAPQKQANVATAVNAPDEDDSEDRSEKESEDAGNEDNLEDKSDESDESVESEDEDDMDRHSDELLDEDEKTKDEGVHYDVAVQGGIAHGNMGQLVVSFRCIYILFCISYIVM